MKRLFLMLLFILLLFPVKLSFAQFEVDACYNYHSAGDYQRAIEFGKMAVERYPRNVAAYVCLGASYYKIGELKLALEAMKRAESLATSKKDLMVIYNQLGNIYKMRGDLDSALLYHSRELSLSRELGNKRGEAIALGNIAGIYDKKGELDKALEYYELSLRLKTEDKDKAPTYNNIAIIYLKKGDYKKAIEYLEKAIEIGIRVGNYHGVAQWMLNLGEIYRRAKEFSKAEETLKEGLTRIQRIGDKYWEAGAYKYLGWLYRDMGRTALAKKYFTKAFELYKSIGAESAVEEVRSFLSEFDTPKPLIPLRRD